MQMCAHMDMNVHVCVGGLSFLEANPEKRPMGNHFSQCGRAVGKRGAANEGHWLPVNCFGKRWKGGKGSSWGPLGTRGNMPSLQPKEQDIKAIHPPTPTRH